jgi:hypothetical protein
VVVVRPAREQVVSITAVDGERRVVAGPERARVEGVRAVAGVEDDFALLSAASVVA